MTLPDARPPEQVRGICRAFHEETVPIHEVESARNSRIYLMTTATFVLASNSRIHYVNTSTLDFYIMWKIYWSPREYWYCYKVQFLVVLSKYIVSL